VSLAILSLGTMAGCAPLIVGGAAMTAGYTATTSSETRGAAGAVSDIEIQTRINELWLKHSLALFHSLSLTVDQGRVLITGRAADPQMRLDAGKLAWDAPGVKEVLNEAAVDNQSGLVDSARDTWITTQLRTALLFDSEVKSQNYSIDTVNGAVYLLGVARTQAELDKVLNHARNLAYVQRVVSHVRLL
jgi:osmotically-inducible protein OsmY